MEIPNQSSGEQYTEALWNSRTSNKFLTIKEPTMRCLLSERGNLKDEETSVIYHGNFIRKRVQTISGESF